MDHETPLPTLFDGESPLHVAVRSGWVEDVRKVLDQQIVDVNCLNSKHETPLHLACSLGHTDIVVLLIAFGADPFIKDSDGNIAYRRCSGQEIGDLMNKWLCHNNLWINGPDNTNGDTLLHTAVRQGDLANAQRLILKQNMSVNDTNESHETPLHLACALGYEPIVHLLVSNGADMYKRDCYNNAPIHRAVAKGHVEVVNLLITSFSCDPKVLTGYHGRTLLHFASAAGNIELITTTIEVYEINPLAGDAIGQTPLHIAASHGQEEVVSLLIAKYNSPVDCRSSYNLTPLHLACFCGHIRCIKCLICVHKADLSLCDDGDTALHKACLGGNSDVVKFLITEFKANIHALNYQHSSPIMWAALGGHTSVIKTLINEFRCNTHEKRYDGRSLLHQACDKGHTKLSVMLITEFKLDPCLADDSGNTPLHMACWGGHEKLARLLITKYNCPVDVKNKQNETPLHKACFCGHINVVKMLVEKCKADLSACNDQKSTPMHLAALGGQKDIVESLINEFQCNPHEKGYDGRSLLHYACEKGHTELAVMLITEFKLDPCLADDSGNTPLHMACWCGHEELARLLITKYNCPVDVKNRTSLYKACFCGYINGVKILVTVFVAYLNERDYENNTPLSKAALGGHTDLVRVLIEEFKCNPLVKGFSGRSLLHQACEKGHTNLAVMLITEFKLDPCFADDSGDTPLHIACGCGHEELARLLITKYNCPVDVKNKQNETPFYLACTENHINVVRMLASDFLGSLKENPLKRAIDSRNAKVVHVLYTESGDTISIKGCESKPFLHQVVYGGGSAPMLRELISNFSHDPACVDDDGNTLLHTAAQCGKEETVQMLTGEYSGSCPIDSRNSQGQTPLHCASVGGHVSVVKSLLLHKASVYIKDEEGHIPIKKANLLRRSEVVHAILSEFGFHSKNIDLMLLHQVCGTGSVEFMDCLISDFELDPSTMEGNSLLHTAVSHGRLDMVRHILEKYKLESYVECQNSIGQTPLHLICSKAPANSVEGLLDLFIREYKADVTSEDNDGNQPIHAAALAGRTDVVTTLMLNYGCDSKARGHKQRSPLHLALANGFTSTGKVLIDDFNLSIHCTDDDGNTPLHLSSLSGQRYSVRLLLYDYHAPVFVRNKAGKTALDLAKNETIKEMFTEYIRSKHKRIQAEYEKLRSLSLQKYPGKQRITRVFVLGNVGSGKSTLVKSIKTKGYFSYWFSVSEVPPHTAGIVPSMYESKETGRFLCYDFAGDKEYYSSHSAILEIVTQSTVGTSVYVIVADLTKELSVLFKEIGYWLSFISYHGKMMDSEHKLKAVIVLSHSDCLGSEQLSSSKSDNIKRYFQLDKNFNDKILDIFDVITSDCRKPYSSKTVEDSLQRISRDTHPCNLSFESTLLHGLLEKDFRNVVACKLRDVVNHVKDTGICLPAAAVALHPIVKELHDIGLLMMIGRSDEPLENHLLLLNPCALTNEVHQNLFSMEAKQNFTSIIGTHIANMGIIPESNVCKLLPKHITKDCLIQLQYCQEFSHTEVGLDHTVTPNASESKDNVLYFPALCNLESKSASWSQSGDPDHTFRIGWYAKCKESFDYFPSRFLHVVLLRLAFTLALPSVSESSVAQAYGRRCTMWKNGIQWLMEERVKCIFEMVDDNKGIVVITKAEECCDELYTTLRRIIDTVMQAKREFCDTALMRHFLLDSDDPQSFKDGDKLFEINDIERVIREGKKGVVSVSGQESITSSDSRLLMLKNFSYWGKFKVPSLTFSITYMHAICISVIQYEC